MTLSVASTFLSVALMTLSVTRLFFRRFDESFRRFGVSFRRSNDSFRRSIVFRRSDSSILWPGKTNLSENLHDDRLMEFIPLCRNRYQPHFMATLILQIFLNTFTYVFNNAKKARSFNTVLFCCYFI
ncbi:hypothetical protein [Lysinibacillus sp. CTST325]